MTNYKNIGFTPMEKKYLSRRKKDYTETFLVILILTLLCTLSYLVIDMFIVPDPAKASQELTDMQVHEEWAGQTVKYCKEYLTNN